MRTVTELAQLDAREVAEKILEARRDESRWLDELSEALDRGRAGQALGRILDYLKRDRIPAVVRRQAAGLDGKSLFDLVAESRTRDVLEACRLMFDFGESRA